MNLKMRKQKDIIVIEKTVGRAPRIRRIENDYIAIREYIGGTITALTIANQVAIYCHDEAILEGLPLNFLMEETPIFGNALFIAVDKDGENRDLATSEIMPIMNSFIEL